MEVWQRELIRKNAVELHQNTTCTTEFLLKFYEKRMISQEEMVILKNIKNRGEQVAKFYDIIQTRCRSYSLLVEALQDTTQSGAHKILNEFDSQFREVRSISYWKTRLLGKGCYGTRVYRGRFDDQDVAVKVLNTEILELERAEWEVEFVRKLGSHDNIVKYLKTEKTEDNVLIALELCNSNLLEWVTKQHSIQIEVEEVLLQATEGVKYLHSYGIIHGDLKPANILIQCRPEWGKILVKISDFGMSKIIPADNGAWPTISLNQTMVAVEVWSAPEILLQLGGNHIKIPQNLQMDIFSLGCIFYFVLTGGLHPFGNKGLIISGNNILQGKFDLREEDITRLSAGSSEHISLIKGMIAHDSTKRPEASEVRSRLLCLQWIENENSIETVGHQNVPNIDSTNSKPADTNIPEPVKEEPVMSTETIDESQTSSSPHQGQSKNRLSTWWSFRMIAAYTSLGILAISLIARFHSTDSRPIIGNHRDGYGNTLLHTATRDQDESMISVKELVQHGVNVNAQNKNLETPLVAASHGTDKLVSLQFIKILLDNGSDPYIGDKNNMTFLHYLVDKGHLVTPSQFHDISKYLVEHKLSSLFNMPGGASETNPFQVAVRNIEVETRTLTLLHQNGVNFNVVSKHHGYGILFYALEGRRSARLVSDLISLGANVQHRDKLNRTLLHSAAAMGNLDRVKFFINKGLDINAVNSFGSTPLHGAVELGKENVPEIVDLLIKHGAYARIENKKGKFPLEIALERDDLNDKDKVVQLLRACRRDKVDEFGNTPLHNAAYFQDEENVERLVESGADLNERNDVLQTPLITASLGKYKRASLRIIRLLIDNGAKVYLGSHGTRTFLPCLISTGSPLKPSEFHDIVDYLISKKLGRLFNIRGRSCQVPIETRVGTPMQEAVTNIEIQNQTLNLLYRNGVNFDVISTPKSNSILAYALAGGRSVRLISDIVSFGVSFRHLNKLNQTFLHIAAQFSHLDGVKYFLKQGLDINHPDLKGNTALHLVAKWGTMNVLEIIKVLIEAGAKVSIQNKKGKSAFDIALRRNDLPDEDDIIDLLKHV